MRFQSTHVMARANHIELSVFMLARLRLKEVHRPLHGELLRCLTSFLKSCTHTFICVKPEGDTKWRIHNVTSFLSSWQLLQPHNFQQVWNFGLWVRYERDAYEEHDEHALNALAFKPISASVCFFSTRSRSILSSLRKFRDAAQQH